MDDIQTTAVYPFPEQEKDHFLKYYSLLSSFKKKKNENPNSNFNVKPIITKASQSEFKQIPVQVAKQVMVVYNDWLSVLSDFILWHNVTFK